MGNIRIADGKDAAAVLNIYSPFILHSGITQETEIPSVDEFRERISATLKERPWLVCEMENEIAGYAYAGKYRDRNGYQWNTELSVYIHENFYRNGVGNALYAALYDILKLQGYVNGYAVITLPNERSTTFHEKFGFRYFTTYKKVGFKHGQWHDVGWWEIEINKHTIPPPPITMFPDLDTGQVSEICRSASLLLKK